MTIGEKIAVRIPDPVIKYATEHPTALCVATFALTMITMSLFVAATELDLTANRFRRLRLAELQLAASEALGG